jgi:peptidoglycan/LPS O-acetylase OafA/YrhL
MGIFRLILAICVIAAHAINSGMPFLPGSTAVDAFFIVSGFYMAMILREKYTGKNSFMLFITNRFLKLFPVYWAVLLLTIAFSCVGGLWKGHWLRLQPILDAGHIGFGALLLIILTNLLLVGQDIIAFLTLDSKGGFVWNGATPAVSPLCVIGTAWSIGIELVFYLSAPFLVRRNYKIFVTIISLSLLLRMVLYLKGFSAYGWTNMCLPLEFAFFLSGMLTYKMYAKIKTKQISKILWWSILGSLILLTCFYQWIPYTMANKYVYLFFVALSVPIAFKASKGNRIDRLIGEFSYPVYISHLLILGIVDYFIRAGNRYEWIATAILSILFSAILFYFIVLPVDKLRQSRVSAQ